MPLRWLSGRAVALHLALAVALPLCGVAAWWQIHRALTGNTLSWLYVLEWPAFGAIAVWLWWVLLAGPARGDGEPRTAVGPQAELLARRSAPIRWDAGAEPPALQAYNAFLADLNAGRPASRPKRPLRARDPEAGART